MTLEENLNPLAVPILQLVRTLVVSRYLVETLKALLGSDIFVTNAGIRKLNPYELRAGKMGTLYRESICRETVTGF